MNWYNFDLNHPYHCKLKTFWFKLSTLNCINHNENDVTKLQKLKLCLHRAVAEEDWAHPRELVLTHLVRNMLMVFWQMILNWRNGWWCSPVVHWWSCCWPSHTCSCCKACWGLQLLLLPDGYHHDSKDLSNTTYELFQDETGDYNHYKDFLLVNDNSFNFSNKNDFS